MALGAHLPPDTIFAINGWKRLGGLWAGSEGGDWIEPVTGRQPRLSHDYAYGTSAY